MTSEELEKFRNLLEEDKKGLESKIKRLTKADFGDDVDSLEEESDETEEMATNEALTNAFAERLGSVNEALLKIEKGTYGVCENCGNKISSDILEINPESKLCKDCKAKNG